MAGARLARSDRRTPAGVDRLWAGGRPTGRLPSGLQSQSSEQPGSGLVVWCWDLNRPPSLRVVGGFRGLSPHVGKSTPFSSQAPEAWPGSLARRLLLPSRALRAPAAEGASGAGSCGSADRLRRGCPPWLAFLEGRTWERLALCSG